MKNLLCCDPVKQIVVICLLSSHIAFATHGIAAEPVIGGTKGWSTKRQRGIYKTLKATGLQWLFWGPDRYRPRPEDRNVDGEIAWGVFYTSSPLC